MKDTAIMQFPERGFSKEKRFDLPPGFPVFRA
jgi:hypothetical protein